MPLEALEPDQAIIARRSLEGRFREEESITKQTITKAEGGCGLTRGSRKDQMGDDGESDAASYPLQNCRPTQDSL